MPWTRGERRAFHRELVRAFPTVIRAQMVIEGAAVEVTRVHLAGSNEELWYSAVEEAGRAGRLDALLAIAMEEASDPRAFAAVREGSAAKPSPPQPERAAWGGVRHGSRRGLTALVGVVLLGVGLLLTVPALADWVSAAPRPWLRSASVVAALLGVALLWVAASRRSKLLSPTSLHEMLRDEEPIPRDDDVDRLVAALTSNEIVVLHGEAGVGRSAVLQQLHCRLQSEGDTLVVSVPSLGGRWNVTEQRLVGMCIDKALPRPEPGARAVRSATGEESGMAVTVRLDDVARLLDEGNRRRLVLILPRLDEYFAAHARELGMLVGDDADMQLREVDPERLLENTFWAKLQTLLREGRIQVVGSLSYLEPDALPALRRIGELDAVLLERLPAHAFEEMLDRRCSLPGVVADPDRGWEAFRQEFVRDLQREDRVLPFHARFALRGFRARDVLTPAEFDRRGRSTGLCARAMRDAVAAVSRVAHVTVETVEAVLYDLSSRDDHALPSASTILAALPAGLRVVKLGQVVAVLEHLARERIVRRYGSDDRSAWRIRHDFIRTVVRSMRQPTLDPVILYVVGDRRRNRGSMDPMLFASLVTSPARLRVLRNHPELKEAWKRVRRHLVIYAGVVLAVAVIYLGGSDAGFSLPFGSKVQFALDHLGASAFRRPLRPAARLQRARSIQATLLGVVRSRAREDSPSAPWGYCQTAAGRLVAGEADATELRQIGRELTQIFAPPIMVSVDDSLSGPFGLSESVHSHQTFVTPLLWCGTALAACHQHEECHRAVEPFAQGINHSLLAMLARHMPSEGGRAWDGGWTLYPAQESTCARSVYHSGLALMMLQEMSRAPEEYRLTGTSKMLRATHDWLVQQFRSAPALAGDRRGWPAQFGHVLPARPGCSGEAFPTFASVTEQTACLLLRDLDDRSLLLPGILRDGLTDVLAAPEPTSRDPVSDLHYFWIRFQTAEGRQVSDYVHPVRFLYHPWVIGARWAWLRQAERLGSNRFEVVTRQRTLDRYLDWAERLANDRARRQHVDLFILAETLYVLGSATR